MSNNKHFIFTSDPETSKALSRDGIQFWKMDGKYFIHINDWSKQNFSENVDQSKIGYTNKISI